MHKPSYIPQNAWNIMSNKNKTEFFKNQKIYEIINIDSDNDEYIIKENKPEIKLENKPEIKLENKPEIKLENKPEIKLEIKPEIKLEIKPEIKPEILNNKEESKKTYINYYKNKLFELQNGCWIIRNSWRRKQLQVVNIDNLNIPNKVYKLYYDIPINLENIVNYTLFLDGREIDKLHSNILLNEWNTPREYIILIYLKNNKYPICYEYCFSNYSETIFKQNNGYNIELNKKFIQHKEDIKNLESQIFILQNL